MEAVTHPERRHNLALDGVRGVAILLVLVHHWKIPLPETTHIGRLLHGVTECCWVGVDLFFCLSGFLITGILADTVGTPGFFRNFYARRVLRIAPLYYGLLLVLLLLTPVLKFHWGPMFWLLAAYLQNTGWLIVPDQYGLSHGLNLTPYWSLAVEEQFYLFWPVLFAVLGTRGRRLWAAVGLSAAALMLRTVLALDHASIWSIYTWTPSRMDTLLLGGALALLLREPDAEFRAKVLRWMPWAGALAAACLLPSLVAWRWLDWRDSLFLQTAGFTLIAVACCGVLAWTQDSRHGAWLRNPGLRYVGRISYGIYVLHLLFFRTLYKLLEDVLRHVIPVWQVAAVIAWGSTAAIVIALAALSFRYFERPILGLKRRFEYRRV